MDNKVKFKPIFYLMSSLIGLVFFVLLSFSVEAASSDYQRCKSGVTCIIGEFLYDDNYSPIATASCTLTTRDPGGSVFINSASMSATTDGWYSYDVNTTSQTEGLYRSQMCCTEPSGYLCLDKSFYIGPSFLSTSEVENSVWNATTDSHTTTGTFGKNLQKPVLSAAEIWGYTDRTLSGFGTLIADIWSYSTRSLTSFGTLIADIWKNDERTLTSADLGDSEELATLETVEKTGYSVVDNATSQNGNKNTVDSLNFGKGTILFEITVTNPSPLITQKVPFVYYFPNEVKKEDIIKIDEKLETVLDNNKQILGVSTVDTALFVSGEIELPPLAKKIYKIEIKDIWALSKEEIESFRIQAKNLFEPLKNTSYFASGATLKSDIDVNLDRALLLQKNPLNPEEKIENYRRAMAEFNLAKAKIDNLKTLVAQAGSAKTLFGFIGGVQVASVWGLILVFITGFVSIILFMKSQEGRHGVQTDDKKSQVITENNFFDFLNRHKIKIIIILLTLLSGILLGNLFSPNGSNNLAAAQKSIEKIRITMAPTVTNIPKATPTQVVLGLNTKKIFAVVPSGSSVRIHDKPLLLSETIYILKSTSTVNKLDEISDWIRIEIPKDKISSESASTKESSGSAVIGWIAKEFTQEVPQ